MKIRLKPKNMPGAPGALGARRRGATARMDSRWLKNDHENGYNLITEWIHFSVYKGRFLNYN